MEHIEREHVLATVNVLKERLKNVQSEQVACLSARQSGILAGQAFAYIQAIQEVEYLLE